MKSLLAAKALQNYLAAPAPVQRAFDKQLALLLRNLRYPSLCAKKIDETHGIWQARVNRDWRFIFQIVGDA